MALPTTGITTSLVGTTLGISSRDVGTLCTHTNVNRWSKWKPINHTSVTGLTEAQFLALKYGINISELASTVGTTYNSANWVYNKPTSISPKRLGDFRTYEHTAPVPFLQKHGAGEIIFAKFVNVNTNIMFDIPRTPTALE